MSVTTTENPVAYSLAGTLRDYELHRSPPADDSIEEPNEHPAPSESPASNPPEWPTDHRRVPPYRPVNTELDQSTRRVYLSNGERAFIQMMFFGLRMNVHVGAIWRATGGRINSNIFRYPVGGEY